ncbi:serine-threonine kinase [Paraconexibacter sp. AEG42_29]|uniref:non-specific serine/threonine protein kinase n=1 Tax=Paraconexibacter sp. AEG42_29 TaxID=2997339 RepID=A0AAU7AY35_9ACTN
MIDELHPGDAFAGHRIDAVAGRGGMGVVYRATQLDLDRTVALKLIAPALAGDPLFRERFIRETRVAAGIDHPNVIPVFYAGENESRLYLAMRYVSGEDLRTLVRREGPLDPARAVRILAQVASALDAAHASGIVHRDVKPANVLLGGGEHAYLTDFGLTKRVHSVSGVTQAGGWVGTLGFVSPEQIRGEAVDARTDVYALGCVLFHALTQTPPHQRDSDEGTLWAHLHDPPAALPDSVPAALGAVVARALAKDPADRYPSAGDLGRAMQAAVGQAPAPVTPERTVATGAAAPHGGEPPVDELTMASPAPAAGSQPSVAPGESATVAQTPRGERQTHRTRPQTAFLLVAALSVLAVVGVTALLLLSGDDPVRPDATTTARRLPVEPARGFEPAKLTATIPVEGNPNDVVATARTVWVASATSSRLVRVDARTLKEKGSIDVGVGVGSLAAGYGTLWIAKQKTGSLLRRDIDTGATTGSPVQLPKGLPVAVATGQGGVWVALRRPNEILRFDPKTGIRDRRIVVPKGIQDMTIGYGSVWVTLRRDDAVLKIDPDSGKAMRIPVGGLPKGLAAGDNYIWVCNSADGTVSRIAARSGRVRGTFPVGITPTGVDVGGGSVWVSNRGGGTVSRLSSAKGPQLLETIKGFSNPFAVSARGGDIWITDIAAGNAGHLRVAP